MQAAQRILSFALVVLAGFFIVIWGFWYNPNFDEFFTLPLKAEDFPGNPMYGPLVFAGVAFLIAYFLYPAESEDD